MTFDKQGRPLVRAADIVRIVRRIEQSKRRLVAGGRKFHRLDLSEVVGYVQVYAVQQIGCLLEDAILPGFQLKGDDGSRPVRCPATKHQAIRCGLNRSEFRESRLDRLQGTARQIER